MTPTDLFKLLADDTRLTTLLLIHAEGELCVCELTCALLESQPKVSRHLALLRNAGLLLDRKQGQWVYYRLNPDAAWLAELLQSTAQRNPDFLTHATRHLANMGDRPNRQASCC
ncbi:metalloregulator ArsR/SmtB family transcription factor [Simiduia agarivorans]|uniref:ArsR family transcriptional regulator n=1 Tax=Simiduia agarivorans (strain DSM 21679 / JCM 13881 / BCRC 17597 / SA1) TaxID=1117647 RepID=K4KQ53_SIMAS|nr:metalloregulator ArsR/SmtB family transcription factor [Simiduia agarivorans]AFV00401.1 ArsR family transcriptional regulator [Simiduia agarivorans SA1 = DSM 21679]